ncbi:uncharacterized protein LOC141863261 isoform X2 [Acropora palmata]|uniref:uncharacterized protein LOC141863261 isoform X2 n=1 Tax=Acropora palmata TaxID=6131 RepID=UPI003DA06580
MISKIFAEWKNISFTIQDAIFEEDENERITTYMMSSANFGVFSCAICLGLHLEWVIKLTLITVDHSAMLFGQHRSFQLFSNQWFETSHKEQRRFCYQATNHDSSADGQSKKPTCQGISGCYHCPLAEKKDYGKYIN